MPELRAFYYPYELVEDRNVLYTSLLYFDKLYIGSSLDLEKEEKGALVIEDERSYQVSVAERSEDLRSFLIARHAVVRFAQEVAPLRRAGLVQHIKLPAQSLICPTLLPVLENTQELIEEAESIQDQRENRTFFLKFYMPKDIINNAKLDPYYTALGSRQTCNPDLKYAIMAKVLLCNIAASAQIQALPFTDMQSADEQFRLYLEELSKRSSAAKDTETSHFYKASLLGVRTIQHFVPYLPFHSTEEFIEARAQLADDFLVPYRIRMSQIADQINNEPFTEAFEREIRRRIDDTIQPELQNMVRQIRQSKHNFLKAVARNMWFSTPLPLLMTISINLPLSVSAALSFFVSGLLSYDEFRTELKSIEQVNGLTLLLKLSHMNK